MTRPYAEVIGDPIAHSKSPLIHNFWLNKLGIDAEYRATHVCSPELEEYFEQRRRDTNWLGCNVTIPHKVRVIEYIDEPDRSVKELGAANCVFRRGSALAGANTDVDGAWAAIPGAQTPCCLIGAGGAARATIDSLNFFMGLFDLRVIARDRTRAPLAFPSDCGIKFFGFDEADQAMRDAEAVINASPLGMVGQPPMPQSVLQAVSLTDSRSAVFDMVYSPLQTELLRVAAKHGRGTIDGLVMLVAQAAAAFKHFFGRPAPREHDDELRALLTA